METKLTAKDLMIGDWVYFHNGTVVEPRRVTGVLIPDCIYLDLGYKPHTNLYTISSVEPIPLTSEILEKNGFNTEEREDDPTFPHLAFIMENNEYRVEVTWYDSHDIYESNTGEYLHGAPEVWNMEILGKCGNYDCIKNKLYVHELQHALRLCGIKREIIL